MKQAKLLLLGLLLIPLVACNKPFTASSSSLGATDEVLNDGTTNQAPKITCDLTKGSQTNPFRTISTIVGADTFLDNAKVGDQVHFNCNKTSDEDSASKLQFFVSQDYSSASPTFNAVSGSNFDIPADKVGRFPMAVKVVDSQGLERIKTFTLVVECQNVVTPVVDLSKVLVSPTSKLNYFNYSVPASAVSGGANFQFSWDFNGDNVYDPVSLADPNEVWTSQNTLSNIYSIFVTSGSSETRDIHLKVKNDCEYESYYTIHAKFPNDNIPRTAAAQAEVKPYFYLQSDISNSDVTNQRRNGHVLVTQYPEDEGFKRIQCDYKKTRYSEKAVFSMKAYNWYKDGATFKHGQEIRIENIADNASTGTQTFSSANNTANLSVVKYLVSEADDGVVDEVYDKNSNCQLTLRVIRAVGVQPCSNTSNADFSEGQAITILGEFSCPKLTDSNILKDVKVDNGKFFCQVAPVNQCVGGGGGGGGVPPPEQ